MSVVIELDDDEFAVVSRALGAFRGPRASWASVEADEPGRAGPNVERWLAEASTADAVLAKLDKPTGRKLAGPFEPIDGLEWCTVHEAPSPAYDDALVACDAQMTMGGADRRPCSLVTLYIEVRA